MKLNVLLPVLVVSAGVADAACKFQDVGVFKQKWRLSTYKSNNCINKAYDVTKSGWGAHCVNFPNNVRSFIFTVGGGYVGVDAGCTIFFKTKDNCGGNTVGRSESHWTKSSLTAKGRTMKSAYVQCTKLLRRDEDAEGNEKVYVRGDDDEWYEKISDTEVVRAPELDEDESERVVRRLADIGADVEERDVEEDVEWTPERDVEDGVAKYAERGVDDEDVEQISKRDVDAEEVEEAEDRGIYADEVDEVEERDVEEEEEQIAKRDVEEEEVEEIEERDVEAEEVEEIADRGIYAEEVDEIEERDVEEEEAEEIAKRDVEEEEEEAIEEGDAEAEEVEEITKRDVEEEKDEEEAIEESEAEAEEEEIEERDVDSEEEVEEIPAVYTED